MNLVYEMNKDRGTTIIIPSEMANSLGSLGVVAVAKQAGNDTPAAK
jgi:hypothetical protein